MTLEIFEKELIQLLNKYNVTIQTCGCCGGMHVKSEKYDFWTEYISLHPTMTTDEYKQKEDSERAINGDPRYIKK